MNKLLLFLLLILLLVPQLNGQSKDEAVIKADVVKLWSDAANRKMDKNKLNPEHNIIAYSTGGLWEDLTADKMVASIVGGPNTFDLRPYHINVKFLGSKKDVAYGVSKEAVINLTKYLAIHLAPKIRVNCIVPGGIKNNQEKKFIQKYSKLTPMKRMMKKTELNGMIDYLCSEKSSYVTGSTLVCDGGYTSW